MTPKIPRRVPAPRVADWAKQVATVMHDHGLTCAVEHRALQAGSPAIVRLRALDLEDRPIGGTAVLTLYATGSAMWGGDADAIAYAYEPLKIHGVLP